MAAMGILALAITWDAWELSFIQSAFFVVPVATQLLNMRYILVLDLQLSCAITRSLSPKQKLNRTCNLNGFESFLMFSSLVSLLNQVFLVREQYISQIMLQGNDSPQM